MADKKWLPQLLTTVLAVVIGAAATYYFSDVKAKEAAEIARERLFYSKMTVYLDGSRNTFNHQIDARDRLVQLLERNHGPLRTIEFEEMCREYHSVLTDEEAYMFKKVRGLTDTLYEYNKKMKEEIEDNPQVYVKLRRLNELNGHLSLWISKYESVFVENAEACLVYVGVEEGKGFPKGIDQEIDNLLRMLP